jgi:flavin-binding protein dodecin
MSNRCYGLIEIVGTSTESSDQAIHNAVEKASETLPHLDWYQVTETRGHIVDGRVAHFQVVLKVGYRLGEGAPAILET